MRIDVYLSESGILASRTEAKNLIAEGAVYVDGRQVTKPSFDVAGLEDRIFVDKSVKRYVSRGGVKLAGALTAFGVSPEGCICLDIGASSGGFTDCLLQNGASRVIAVDTGSGQLAEKLRLDKRVDVRENYNARYMTREDFSVAPELAVMDVSFISATYIIPSVAEVLAQGGSFICLIKPQFEVGKAHVGKGGIVKDETARELAKARVISCALENGFTLGEVIKSPIKGGDGNVEYLAHFVKSK